MCNERSTTEWNSKFGCATRCTQSRETSEKEHPMIKKVLPVLVLSAFIAAPLAVPAQAGATKAEVKCEKIKDVKLKNQCIQNLKKQKK
jgi:hypothetical protein